MNNGDRRQRVEDLCYAALEQDPAARAAFLAAACGDDEGLRGEVEALLAHAQTAEGFLAAPLGELAAQKLSDERGASLLGWSLGVYQIQAKLGSGGMGDVYRARDTRLGRDVAVKVLSPAFLGDADRVARFAREARVLPTLNHPHIGAIYGLEETSVGGADASTTVRALVLELVEGQTLSDRLARGRLPLREATAIARQIASALDAAHEKGIVHRDLKPANVKITPDGVVKVLDFGIAKTSSGERAAIAGLPELTSGSNVTREGTILGTVEYMSPEQARGKPVDKRTDVWAFGCVLYEMLTGRAPFTRATPLETLTAILEREPDWTLLPKEVPPALRDALRRCLTKDTRFRLRDIGDAALDDAPPEAAGTVAAPKAVARRSFAMNAVWGIAGLLIGAALFAAWSLRSQPPTAGPVTQFEIPMPEDALLRRTFNLKDLAISPDGARLAFPAARGLTIRSLGKLDMETLDLKNEVGLVPFFSPDGRWIGYFSETDSAIKKVSVTGGYPITVAQVSGAASGKWTAGHVVFADATGLYRVAENGGPPEKLPIALGANEQAAFPEILPGGQAVLFTVLPARTNASIFYLAQDQGARIDALDLRTRRQSTIVWGGGRPQYARSGHLLYAFDAKIYAIVFDGESLKTRGEPGQIDVESAAEFAVSDDGTLAYLSGRPKRDRELVWVDRHGREESLGAPSRYQYNYARLSPDGTRVAVDALIVMNGISTSGTFREESSNVSRPIPRKTVARSGAPTAASRLQQCSEWQMERLLAGGRPQRHSRTTSGAREFRIRFLRA